MGQDENMNCACSCPLFCCHPFPFKYQVVASGRHDVTERTGQFFSGNSKYVLPFCQHFLLGLCLLMLWWCNDADSRLHGDILGLDTAVYFVEGEFGSSRLLSSLIVKIILHYRILSIILLFQFMYHSPLTEMLLITVLTATHLFLQQN